MITDTRLVSLHDGRMHNNRITPKTRLWTYGSSILRPSLVYSGTVPVVAVQQDLTSNFEDLVVVPQNMHGIDLGDFSEPETPFRAPAKRLPAGCDEPKELGEVLAPAAASFEHKREEFDRVTTIVDAVLSVLVKLLIFPLLRGVSGILSSVPERVRTAVFIKKAI